MTTCCSFPPLVLTSLLSPDPQARCSEARSELELAPSELMSTLSPLDSRLVWMASRSSSFTMGVKLVKSSRVSVPGGERQGTRAEQLMSASEGPECCSIILETKDHVRGGQYDPCRHIKESTDTNNKTIYKLHKNSISAIKIL